MKYEKSNKTTNYEIRIEKEDIEKLLKLVEVQRYFQVEKIPTDVEIQITGDDGSYDDLYDGFVPGSITITWEETITWVETE